MVEVDSCLEGAGGISQGQGFYSTKFLRYLTDLGLSILSLECLNLLFAVRLWVDSKSGANVLLFCDNMATVCAVGSARAEDPLIRGGLTPSYGGGRLPETELTVRHKPGLEMTIPDILSRAHNDVVGNNKFREFNEKTTEKEIQLDSRILMPLMHL